MFYRSKHKAGFTIIDNGFLSKESGLSLDARGLLATILSLPDDWQFSERGLCQILPDGRRRIHGALAELEQAGYITRGSQGRDQAGRMTAKTWDVFESPQVATDARLPRAETVQQVITKDKELKSKGADFGAFRTAPNQPQLCPACGKPDNVRRAESGMLTCSCSYAWKAKA